MTTIKTLIDIEEILLNADSDFRYEYSLDELIKSEKYIREIGSITNLFFSVQVEYGKINHPKTDDDKQKIVDYHNKLISDKIDVDISKYIEFINSLKPFLDRNPKYSDKIEKLMKK